MKQVMIYSRQGDSGKLLIRFGFWSTRFHAHVAERKPAAA